VNLHEAYASLPRPRPSRPPAAEVVRRVEEAKRDGSFGRLRKAGGVYRATCGGCAERLELDENDRFDARLASRELGWRERTIPGVRGWRQFCVGCLRDMDLEAIFAIAADGDPQEGYARWANGNPYLPSWRYGQAGLGSPSGPP
jgi:hypothetical protein